MKCRDTMSLERWVEPKVGWLFWQKSDWRVDKSHSSLSLCSFYESLFSWGVGSFPWPQTRAVGLGCIVLAFLLTALLSPQDTYYLSAEECITAGNFQNQHPNICRLSPDGHFGSKFVTVVATGTNGPQLAPALLLHTNYLCLIEEEYAALPEEFRCLGPRLSYLTRALPCSIK